MPTPWRWTAVFVHALRHALCPSPGLLALMDATARGELGATTSLMVAAFVPCSLLASRLS